MEFKPDWHEAKQRLAAWWHGEVIGRVALHVTAPRSSPIPVAEPTPADSLVDRWTDPDYRIGRAEQWFAKNWFGGEAFPYFDSNVGPGSLALFLGCEPVLAQDTVWYQPCMGDPDAPPRIRLDQKNRWWKASRRLIEEGVRRGEGRYLTSIPDLIENLDIVASLRGTSPLLEDLLDRPQQVQRWQRQVQDAYYLCFDDLYALVEREGGCCYSAFSVWGPGKVAKVQCDFSAMISPRMFEEFVVPYLSEQCDRLDYTVYHLDGPEAVKHLDLILSIPGLNALQWTPGSNQPGLEHAGWLDIYRRARKAGKSLLLLGVPSRDVERLVEQLGPEGLLIGTGVASQQEGEALLQAAKRWK